MAQTDREALVALFNATDGLNWKENANWDTHTDLSKWYGVNVNDQGRVVLLSLFSNNLQGTIPKELGKLTAIQRLSLAGNQLSGPIPPELGKLAALETLTLQWNQLSGTIPKELGKLTALQRLSLAANQLSGLWDVLGQKNAKSMAARPGALPAALASLLDMFDRVDRRGVLYLSNNPWEHPPEAIVEGGMLAVRGYYDAIFRDGATTVTRPLKVVIVGKETVGKTSLRCSIKEGKPRMAIEGGVESTVHVDVEDHELDGHPIRMFDCAGQVFNIPCAGRKRATCGKQVGRRGKGKARSGG
eukprot:g15339.t1